MSADATDGEIAIHGPSIALCVRHGSESSFANCLGKSNQIVIWNTDSGDVTRVEIPQDERAPQCVSKPTTLLPPHRLY